MVGIWCYEGLADLQVAEIAARDRELWSCQDSSPKVGPRVEDLRSGPFKSAQSARSPAPVEVHRATGGNFVVLHSSRLARNAV